MVKVFIRLINVLGHEEQLITFCVSFTVLMLKIQIIIW